MRTPQQPGVFSRGEFRSAGFCLLAMLAALETGVRSPLEAANTISMGIGEGKPGEHDVHVIVTATNDVSVHGYSIAFTYPSEVLSLSRVSTNGTSVQELEPEFVGSQFDNQLGVASMGVILTFGDSAELKELAPTSVTGAPRIIARLSFEVKDSAAGGSYPLRLVDGIGNPAQFNRFTNAGTSVTPELVDGQFFVAALSNTLALDKKLAFAGATPSLPITAYVQHNDPLDGFQIAFTYEKDALELLGVTYDATSLGFELGRDNSIEFFSVQNDREFGVDEARATVAALFDSTPPLEGQQLSPNPVDAFDQSLVRYTFNVLEGADDDKQWQDLLMDDDGRPGLVGSRLIFGDRSVMPNLVHGKIYFSTGSLMGRVINAESGEGVPEIVVSTDPDRFISRSNGDGVYRFDDIPPGVYTLRFSNPGFYSGRLTEVLVRGAGETSTAETVSLFKLPPAVLRPFVRGFVNEDGRVDLSDDILLLQHLFQGESAPPCLAAADVNDDNKVDISDAISLLNYLFNGGPPPEPPFSNDKSGCMNDPTPVGDPDRELSCEEFRCAGAG